MPTTSDAVDREVAWLTTSGDGLPALLKAAGGPWDICQAYGPRTQTARKSGIYLLRSSLTEVRFNNHRKMDSYDFRAKLWWPIGSTTVTAPIWEQEQRGFDAAIDLLIQRLRGLPQDHTHGGRFLTVGETPGNGRITVRFEDPERTANANPAALIAEAFWPADDNDFTA
ncbi:MAG: hypothetical protein JWO67_3195 [Streptosporangiaceae bacterium]|nr:hypothetical protein [Streptosporangiaceae bacterium]